MTLVRWRPRREWDPFARLLDLPREFFGMFTPSARPETELGEWYPPADVYADEDKVVVQVEVPGMKENEIDVNFHEGVLTIKGERKQEGEYKEEGYHRLERCYGSFHRAIRLPAEVDGSKAKAELKDGILTIAFPKAEEAKARPIKIEAK